MPRKRAIRSKKYNLAAHRLTSSQAQPLLTTTTKTRTRDISMSLDAIRNFDRSNRPPIHFPWEEIRLDQNPTCKMWFSARFVCHLQRIVEWLPTSRRKGHAVRASSIPTTSLHHEQSSLAKFTDAHVNQVAAFDGMQFPTPAAAAASPLADQLELR